MYTDVESELLALVDFIETGLLPPSLAKRLALFPQPQLHIALRDLLDWLSVRAILRGTLTRVSNHVHPLTGRVLAQLPALSQLLCAPDIQLTYRVEIHLSTRESLEDFARDRIWHAPWSRPAKPLQVA